MINTELLKKEIAFKMRLSNAIQKAVKSVFAKHPAKKESKPKKATTYNNVPDRVETIINALQSEIQKNKTHAK